MVTSTGTVAILHKKVFLTLLPQNNYHNLRKENWLPMNVLALNPIKETCNCNTVIV